jgi:hypothetical protein
VRHDSAPGGDVERARRAARESHEIREMTSPEERTDLIDCVECGVTIDLAFDRPYAITDEVVLCHTCGLRRGGAYDSDSERWVIPPRLDAIPEERVPQP